VLVAVFVLIVCVCERQNKNGMTALTMAMNNSHSDDTPRCKLLIDAGAEKDGVDRSEDRARIAMGERGELTQGDFAKGGRFA
jgi:hypothetical protein